MGDHELWFDGGDPLTAEYESMLLRRSVEESVALSKSAVGRSREESKAYFEGWDFWGDRVRDPAITRDEIEWVLDEGTHRWAVRRSSLLKPLAQNPAVPADLLWRFRTDPLLRPWLWLTPLNPSCPPDLLELLATHTGERVRCFVAENPNTPAHVIATLTEDESPEVQDRARVHHHSGGPGWKVTEQQRREHRERVEQERYAAARQRWPGLRAELVPLLDRYGQVDLRQDPSVPDSVRDAAEKLDRAYCELVFWGYDGDAYRTILPERTWDDVVKAIRDDARLLRTTNSYDPLFAFEWAADAFIAAVYGAVGR